MALAFAIGTGTVAGLVLTEEPAEAGAGTVNWIVSEPFNCNYLYEVKNANSDGMYRWRTPGDTSTRQQIYGMGTGWSPSDQANTIGVGPDPTNSNVITARHWSNTDATVRMKKVTYGSNAAPEATARPGASGGSNDWAGGEVRQDTGEVYLTGHWSADVQDNGDGDFKMAVYNPVNGQFKASSALAPRTNSDALSGVGSTRQWRPFADMAIDAEGSAYIIVSRDSSDAHAKWLLRVKPGTDGTTWLWDKVVQLSAYPGTTYPTTNSQWYGMAFINGILYASQGSDLWAIDTMTGQMYRVATGISGGTIYDLAACQAAPVIRGTVFNDANGNGQQDAGEAGIPGQVVSIYGNDGRYIAVRYTDGSGGYSFIVNRVGTPSARFFVRLKHPKVGGVNAAQTYASGSTDGNLVLPWCATATEDYARMTESGVCRGARRDHVDTNVTPTGAPTAANGITGATNGAGILTEVTMLVDTQVAVADFGVTTAGSHGDAPWKTNLTTDANKGPTHVAAGVYADDLWLGAAHDVNDPEPGPSSAGVATDPHGPTDDGVEIRMSENSPWMPLSESILAINKTYSVRAKVSGVLAAGAKVQGWGGALVNSVAPTASSIVGPAITMDNGGVVAGDGYAYGRMNTGTGNPTGAPPTWARFRVSETGGLSATDIPPYPPTGGDSDTNSASNPWWVPGEVEDYRVYVASGTLALNARSVGGGGSFGFSLGNVSDVAPSSASDLIVTPGDGVVASSGRGHAFASVGLPVTITPGTPPSGFSVTGAECVRVTDSGSVPVDVGSVGGVFTVPASVVVQGAALSCTVSFAREIDSAKSSLLVSPTTPLVVGAGTFAVTASVRAGDDSPLAGVRVRFGLVPSVGAVVDDLLVDGLYHCETDSAGQCSVSVSGSLANVYEVSAVGLNLGTSDGWSAVGTPQSLTYTYDPATCTPTLVTSPTGSQLVNTPFTGTVTLTDQRGNGCTGLGSSLALAPALNDPARVVFGPIQEGTTAGEYTFSINSTLVGVKNITVTHTRADSSTAQATGSVEFTAKGPSRLALSVTPSSLLVTETATARAELQDEHGNLTAGTVHFTTNTPTVDGVYEWDVQTVNGVATQGFTTEHVGTYQVSATVVGAPSVVVSPASVSVTFDHGPVCASKSTLTAGVEAGVPADGTSTHTATVTVRDCQGNIVPNAPVKFTNEGIGTFTNPGGTATEWSAVTGSLGTITATLVSANVTGNARVSAQFGEPEGVVDRWVPMSETNPNRKILELAFIFTDVARGTYEVRTPTSPDIVANGSDVHTVWVRLFDSHGTPVQGAADQIDMAVDPVADLGMPATGTDAGVRIVEQATPGLYEVSVRSRNAGVFPAGGTGAGFTLTKQVLDGAETIRFVEGRATNATLDVPNHDGVVADGVETHLVRVTVRDAEGNGVRDAAFTATAQLQGAQPVVYASWVQPLRAVNPSAVPFAGVYEGTIATEVKGSYLVSATVTNTSPTVASASLPPLNNIALFKEGPPCATTSTLEVDPARLTVGSPASATVGVKDCKGNAVTDWPVRFRTVPVINLAGGGEMETGVTGEARIGFTSATATSYGVYAAVLSEDGTGVLYEVGPEGVVFESDSGSGTLRVESVAPLSGSVVARSGDAYTVTVSVKDSDGNGIPAANITPTIPPPGDQAVSFGPVTAVEGNVGFYTFEVRSTTIGPKTIRATYTAGARTSSDEVVVEFVSRGVPGVNTTLTFDRSTARVVTDIVATVTVKDDLDNPIPAANIVLTIVNKTTGDPIVLTNGTVLVGGATGTSGSDGVWRYTFSTRVAAEYEVVASITVPPRPEVFTRTGDVSFTNAECSALSAVLSSATEGSDVSPSSYHLATVQLRDEYGNACLGYDNYPVTFSVGGVGAVDTSYSPVTGNADPATGQRTVRIVSPTFQVGPATVQAQTGNPPTWVMDQTDLSQRKTLTLNFANTGGPCTAESSFTVTGGSQRANGVDAHRVTAVLKTCPPSGPPIPMSGEQSRLSGTAVGAAGEGNASVAGFTEVAGTPGTYVADITSTNRGSKSVSVVWNQAQPNETEIPPADPNNRSVFFDGVWDEAVLTLAKAPTGPVVADGTAEYTVTATVKDTTGRAISTGTVTREVLPPIQGVTVSQVTPTANPGVYTFTVKSSEIGDKPVRVTFTPITPPAPAVAVSDEIVLGFEAGELDGTKTTLNVTPAELVAGETATATVNVRDLFDHVVEGADVAVTVVDSDGNPIVTTSPVTWTGQSGATGNFTVAFSTHRADVYAVTATATRNGQTVSPAVQPKYVEFTHGPPSSVTTTLSSDTAGLTVRPNGTAVHHATVTVRDQWLNPVPGALVHFTIDSGFGVAPSRDGVSGEDGTFTVNLTSTAVGSARVTAIAAGNQVMAGAQIATLDLVFDYDVGPCADPDFTYYTITPEGSQRVNTGEFTVRAHLETCEGEPIVGKQTSLTSTAIGRAGQPDASVTEFTEDTSVRGEYTARITSNYAGIKDVGVKWTPADQPIQPEAGRSTVEFVELDEPDWTKSYYSVSTFEGVRADAVSRQEVYVHLEDRFGNPIRSAAGMLVGDPPAGLVTVSPFEHNQADPGNYTAYVTTSNAGSHVVYVNFTQGGTSVRVTRGGNGQANINAVFVAGGVTCAAVKPVGSSPQVVGTGSYQVSVSVTDGTYDPVGNECSGNPVSGQRIVLDPRTADEQFRAITDPADGIVETGASGVASYTVTSQRAGTFRLVATYGSGNTPASNVPVVVFEAGSPDASRSTITKGDDYPRRSNGEASHEVTITLIDEFGNPVAGRQVRFDLAAGSPAFAETRNPVAVLGPGVDAPAVTNLLGQAVAYIRSAQPVVATPIYGWFQSGSSEVRLVQVGTSSPQRVDLTFEAGGVNTRNSSVEVSTRYQDPAPVADGIATHTVLIRLVDDDGNPAVVNTDRIGGVAVLDSLRIPLTGWTKRLPGDPNNADYVTTFKTTVMGTYTVSGTYDNEAVSVLQDPNGMANRARFIAGQPDPARSTYTVSTTQGVAANGSDTQRVTVRLFDPNGNPTTVANVGDLDASGNPTQVRLPFQAGTGTGEYVVDVTSVEAGSFPMTAYLRYSGNTWQPIALANPGNQLAVFVPGGPSPANSQLVLDRSSQVVGGPVVATVTVRDGYGTNGIGNPITGQQVRLKIDPPTVPGVPVAALSGVTGANGQVSFTFTSEHVDLHTVQAFLVGTGGAETQIRPAEVRTVQFTVGAAAKARLERLSEATAFVGAAASPHRVRVTVFDEYDNPRSGVLVTFAPSGLPAGATYNPASFQAQTDLDGQAVLEVRSTAVGSGTVAASIPGGITATTLLGQSRVDLTFANSPVDPGRSQWWLTTYGETKTADGTEAAGSAHVLRVHLRDTNDADVDDLVLAQSIGVDIGGTMGTAAKGGTNFVRVGPGEFEVKLVSTVADVMTVRHVELGTDLTARTPAQNTAEWVAGNPTDRYSTLAVGSDPAIANGTDKVLVTVDLRDDFNNPVTGKAAQLTVHGGGATTSQARPGATDGTYLVDLTSTNAGDYTVRVYFQEGGLNFEIPNGVNNQVAHFVPGVPSTQSKVSLVTTGDKAITTEFHVAKVVALDADLNPVPYATVVFNIPGTRTQNGVAWAVIANGQGEATLGFTADTVGIYPVTATVSKTGSPPAQATPAGNVGASFVNPRVSGTKSSLTVSQDTNIVANGTAYQTVEVHLVSDDDVPIAGREADLVRSVVPLGGAEAGARFIDADGDSRNGDQWFIPRAGAPGYYDARVASIKAGSFRVGVTVDAIPLDPPVSGRDIASFISDVGDPDSSTLEVVPPRLSVGDSAEVTVKVLDANGNKPERQWVGVWTIAYDPIRYNNATATMLWAQTDANGEAKFRLSTTKPGVYTVYAELDWGEASGRQPEEISNSGVETVEFVALPPSATKTVLSGSTGDVHSDATTYHWAKVTVKDQYENLLAGQTVTFTLTDPSNPAATPIGQLVDGFTASGVTNAEGEFEVRYVGNHQLGRTDVTAKVAAMDVTNGGTGPAKLEWAWITGGATETWYELTGGEKLADGSEAHTVTVKLLDENDREVVGEASRLFLNLEQAPGGLPKPEGTDWVKTEFVEGPPGVYTAQVTSTWASTFDVTVTHGGSVVPPDPTLTPRRTQLVFKAGVFAEGKSWFVVSGGRVKADGLAAHTITVVARDGNGNPIPGGTIGADDPAHHFVSVSPFEYANGVYTASLRSSTAGSHTMTATFRPTPTANPVTVRNVNPDTGQLLNSIAEFESGDPCDRNSSLTITPVGTVVDGSVIANGADMFRLEVELRDCSATPNPVPNQRVTFEVPGVEPPVSEYVTTGDTGRAVWELKSTRAVDAQVSATFQVPGQGTTHVTGSPATVVFRAGPPDPRESTLVGTTGERRPNGVSFHEATVTVKDANANPVSGQLVSFSVGAPGRVSQTIPATSISGPDGKVVIQVVSDLVPGTSIVTAKLGDQASGQQIMTESNQVANVQLVFASGPPGDNSYYALSTGDKIANGTDKHMVTVTVLDADGAPSPLTNLAQLEATALKGTDEATVTVFRPDDDPATLSTYVADVTATRVNVYDVVVTYLGADVGAQPGSPTTLSFIAGPPESFTYVVSARPDVVADGIETQTVTVTVRDRDGNGVPNLTGPGSSVTLAASAPDSAVHLPFSPVPDRVGEYVADITSLTAGRHLVTATRNGTEIATTANRYAEFVHGPVSPTDSDLTVSTGDRRVWDETHWAQVLVVDRNDNPIEGQAVTFTTSPATTPTALSRTVETNSQGVARIEFTTQLAATYTVRAYLGDSTGAPEANFSGSRTVRFIATTIDPAHTVLSGSDGVEKYVNAASDPHTAKVQVRDRFDNPVLSTPAVPVRVQFQVGDLVGASVSDQDPIEVDQAGEANVTVGSSAEGTAHLTARVNGTFGTTPAQLDLRFRTGGPDPDHSFYSVTGEAKTAGVEAHTITVTLRDGNDAPVLGQASAITVSPAQRSVLPPVRPATVGVFSQVTGQPGVYAAEIRSDFAETYDLTVSAGGLIPPAVGTGGTGPSNSYVVFKPGNPVPGASSFTVSEGTKVANGNTTGVDFHTVTITVVDAKGNGVPGLAGSLTARAVPLSVSIVRAVDDDTQPGLYTATITSTTVNSIPVTVNLGGYGPIERWTINNVAVFGPGPSDGPSSTLEAVTSGELLVVAQNHKVRVTARDKDLNPVPDATVTFTTAPQITNPPWTGIATTNTSGIAEFEFTTDVPGVYVVSADILNPDSTHTTPTGSGVVTVAFKTGPIDEAHSWFTVTDNAGVIANGAATQTLTVFLADESGVGITGQQQIIVPGADRMGLTFHGFGPTTTPGEYKTDVTSTTDGTFVLDVVANPTGQAQKVIPKKPDGKDTTYFEAGPADEAHSQLSALPLVQVVDQNVEARVLVQDAFDNKVEGQSVEFWVQDANGNTVPLPRPGGGPSLTPRSQADGYARISFTTPTAGLYTVYAGLAGLGDTPRQVIGSGLVVVEFTAIRNPDLSQSFLHGSDATPKLVGGNDPAGVHFAEIVVRDASTSHNPIPNLDVEFTIAGVTGPRTVTAQTGPDGVARIELTSQRTGDTYVTARALDETAQPPAWVTVPVRTWNSQPASRLTLVWDTTTPAPDKSSFVVSQGNRTADGHDPHTITVTVLDEFENGVAGQAANIHAVPVPADQHVVIGTFVALNPDSYPFDGLYVANVTSTVDGDKTIAVTLGTDPVDVGILGRDVARFVAGNPDPARSWFEVDPAPATADGIDTVAVRAVLRDQSDNGATGRAGLLHDPVAQASGVDPSKVTVTSFVEGSVAGEYVAYVKATQVARYTVSVDYDDPTVGTTVGLRHVIPATPTTSEVIVNNIAQFVADDPSPGHSTLSVSQGEVEVGGTHTATVVVRDGLDNPVGGVDVRFWTDPDITADGSITPVGGVVATAEGTGIAQIVLRTTHADRYTVFATIVDPDTGLPAGVRYSGQVSVVFVAGPPSSTTSTLDIPTEGVDPVEVANGENRHTATVTVRDSDLNPVPGQRATFRVVPPGGTLADAQELTSGASGPDGVASVTFNATVAGVYTVYGYITVSGSLDQVSQSPKTATFVPGPPDPLKSVIVVQVPKTVEANGIDRTTAIVTLRDKDDNVTGPAGAGHHVTVITTVGTASAATDNGDGTYTVTLTSTTAGLANVGFELDGVASQVRDTATFVATPTAPVLRYGNASTVAGSAQPGNTIRVFGPDGSEVCVTLAGSDGRFVCQPLNPAGAHGTVLSVTSAVTVGGRTFTSAPSSVTVDAVAPDQPHVNPSDGGTVTGEHPEPGTTVVITDEDGSTELCRTVVGADGTFVCEPLDPRPGDGDKIVVVVVDDSDNPSEPWIEVIDDSPPDRPHVEETDGSVIYGDGEEGSHIVITDGGGNVVCETDADARTGGFSCTPTIPLEDGDEVHVTATDPAGNVSDEEIRVVDQSTVPSPFINPTNGETVTGRGVPGLEITVRFPDGSSATTTVRTDGTWQLRSPDGYRPTDGDNLTVTQSRQFNQAGAKVSAPATIRVDRTAPDIPTVNPSDGTTISGTGEPGATVVIRDSDGKQLGQTVVEANGEWTARLEPAAAEGSTVTVTQTDPAGNQSKPVTLRVGKIRIVVDVPLLRNLETQTVHVYNLQPGEKVTATMYSDPYNLGTMVADATGSAVYKFDIPIDTTDGAHHVEATGEFSGKAVSGYFNVVPPQAPVIPATATVTPTITYTATPTITPTVAVEPKTMPKTGAEGMIPAAGGALGALLAGLFLILAATKRRHQIEQQTQTTTHGGNH
jgi:hypothetical protein